MSTPNDPRIVQPYVCFEGRTEEALDFYKQALGAEVVRLLRFKDSPEAPPPGMVPAGCENKIMHSQFRVGQTIIMASDGRCSGQPKLYGFSLALSVKTEADAEKYFKALAEGGHIQMPLTKTFFSPSFGVVLDRFGVNWMILMNSH